MERKEVNISKNHDEELTDIVVLGAREHNLKNISVKIPRDKFIVITGLSGSGKSSLAFDTIYAEGQRRYVECLSPYAKQFMGIMKKPDVDLIEGLSPAISIEQKSISHNPRSTVGTTTEIYDYLRLLFSKIGLQYCDNCNLPVVKKTIDQILNDIYTKYIDKSIVILAPLIVGRKGHYRELFETLLKQGFSKVYVDGEIINLESGLKLDRYMVHDIDLVIDKILVNNENLNRISESLEFGLNRGEGAISILLEYKDRENIIELYSVNNSCPGCGKSFENLAPNLFSFNSPYGACQKCGGIGYYEDIDTDLIISDIDRPIFGGAIHFLNRKDKDNTSLHTFNWLTKQIGNYLRINKVNPDIPLSEYPKNVLDNLLNASKTEELVETIQIGSFSVNINSTFDGLAPILQKIARQYEESDEKNIISYMIKNYDCEHCGGARLKRESLAVKVGNYNIADLVKMDIPDTIEAVQLLQNGLSQREKLISNIILKEIASRLNFLDEVGLSYLNLNRQVNTLSGGESQRIRLASQIGSKLVGVTYVLDEPSIGLHQHDNDKLIHSLKNLKELGNTVIVVEHDKAMIESSDILVDIGPGAGIHGGEVILNTSPDKLNNLDSKILEKSVTAQYLLNRKKIKFNKNRRDGNGNSIKLIGARGNNLKNVTLELPLAKLICITGMSGSGKSTLINETLFPILSNRFNSRSSLIPMPFKTIEGLEYIDKVIEIDQSPIGRTPRSNPATYTGLFTLIRDLFALLPESKIRGYKPGRFSFNVKGGRCENCEGAGIKKIEMNFLPNVYVKCDVCEGKRYNSETLQIQFKGKSIADVLGMTVEEAVDFFKDIPKLFKKINTLNDVGLGYITLGQQAPTLSGGEAQRVKLATELSKISTGKTLYLLDEPTTGLHFEDINILMSLLQKLVDKGNTVVVIEHNLDVIKSADWIIDLGPLGGKYGGEIIAEGTPEKVAKNKKSLTGKYLKSELKNV
ncbi:MAG TPA: excinuclease ABC subunit UvrA [Candidatus Kapabacteria bacterium]|nr:excinuclease ABC subunit UvrA [Candidatus Kapabacteria bacterium]